jgi:putative acetyltransferase
LTAEVSDNAQEFFKKRGFVPQRRNTVPRGNEWLANTTMEKKLPAKDGTK